MTFAEILQEQIPRNSRVLDIGCGKKDHSNYSENTVTIDAWEKLSPDILMDVTKEPIPFQPGAFDIITMIDFIEHLEKEDGQKLLEQCKKLANKIIVFTPLVFNDNSHNVNNPGCWAYGNPYDYHKSLWTLEDFEGWTTLRIFKHKIGDCWLGYWEK